MNDASKNPQYNTNQNPYQNQMIKKPWNQNKDSAENYGRPSSNQATPKKQSQQTVQSVTITTVPNQPKKVNKPIIVHKVKSSKAGKAQ